jgi:antirestriction protein ArdC
MLFVCYVTIDPENRDESFRRLKEHGIGEQQGVKMLGAWISLTQQETWAIFEADDAASIMKLYHPWTDLNVHEIAPVMSFEALKKIVAEEY